MKWSIIAVAVSACIFTPTFEAETFGISSPAQARSYRRYQTRSFRRVRNARYASLPAQPDPVPVKKENPFRRLFSTVEFKFDRTGPLQPLQKALELRASVIATSLAVFGPPFVERTLVIPTEGRKMLLLSDGVTVRVPLEEHEYMKAR